MFRRKHKSATAHNGGFTRLPNFVHDIRSAHCLFCPYGAHVKIGERVIAWDDRTIFDRMPRECLVEITDIKTFRSNGRMVMLDLEVADETELVRIAEDSETSVDALLAHRKGQPTYISRRPPVVVYFRACEPGNDVLRRVPDLYIVARKDGLPYTYERHWARLKLRLRGWIWRYS